VYPNAPDITMLEAMVECLGPAADNPAAYA